MASRAEQIRARRAQDEEKFVQSLGRYPTTSEMMENDRRLSPGGENPLGRADEFGGELVDAGLALAGGMTDAAIDGGSYAYRKISDLLTQPDRAKEQYDKSWHAPKVTSDQISDAVRPPVGLAYAKPLLNMQGDPEVERQMQAEAKGLMADEAGRKSWHAPMVMPNTPRDPQAEKRQQEMMKQFLANGGGPSYGMKKAPPAPMASIPESQNPFSKATATPDEMASASGQMMKSQIPQAPLPTERMGKPMAEQAPGWSGNPDTMEYERQGATPEMGVPEMADQEYGTGQDLVSDPYANLDLSNTQEPESEARKRLMELAMAEPGKGGVNGDRMALDQAQFDTNSQNRDLGFMQLLMRNANQMGTLGGVAASSKPFDEFASDQQKQNNDSMSLMAKASAGKQADKDERAKMLQFLVGKEMDAKKMQQDAELRREGFGVQRQGYQEAAAGRNAALGLQAENNKNLAQSRKDAIDLRKNPPARPLTAAEQYKLDQAKKGLDEFGHKVVPKPPGPGMQDVRNKAMAGTYDEWVQQGLRSNVQSGIDTLKEVADKLDKDNWGSGTVVGNTPNFILGAIGNNSQKYEAAINGAIASSFKQKLGGSFTEGEGTRLLKNTWDPKQPPKENAARVRRAIKEMEGKMRMQDDAVKHFEANNANMAGYKGGTRATEGASNSNSPSGSWDNAPTMRAEDL